jgi:hypothetical protein
MTDEQIIYLRNLRNCETRVNITGGRKIELQPRGQRGDMESITAEEFKDQKVKDNIGLIFEPLKEETAQAVIDKQNTNRQEPHAPFAAITNQLGEKYQQADIPVEKSFEEQGEVVGKIESQPSLNHQETREEITRAPSIDHDVMSRLIETHGVEKANEIVHSITQATESLAPQQVQVPGSEPADAKFADAQAKQDPQDHVNALRASAEVSGTVKG